MTPIFLLSLAGKLFLLPFYNITSTTTRQQGSSSIHHNKQPTKVPAVPAPKHKKLQTTKEKTRKDKRHKDAIAAALVENQQRATGFPSSPNSGKEDMDGGRDGLARVSRPTGRRPQTGAWLWRFCVHRRGCCSCRGDVGLSHPSVSLGMVTTPCAFFVVVVAAHDRAVSWL